jgi:MYXO-CTERM domain-containing protein
LPSQSLNLQGGEQDVTDTGTVTVSYDKLGELTVAGSDSGGDTINLATTVDLSELGGAAFIGFAGASGGGSADEEIASFSLSVGSSAPEPITALLALPALALLAALRRRKSLAEGPAMISAARYLADSYTGPRKLTSSEKVESHNV